LISRRDFIKGAGAAATLALGGRGHARPAEAPPNILLLLLDESRLPAWFPADLDSILPARARLASRGVSFTNIHANAVACSPNRASLLTGLYAQQHWILRNCHLSVSLDPGFPTLGTMFRRLGYDTYYFGKWHLTFDADWPVSGSPRTFLQGYGFDRWHPQSEDELREYLGGVNEGFAWDGPIASAACAWLDGLPAPGPAPWFSIVSLINPHDIAWYPRYTRSFIAQLKRDGLWQNYDVEVPGNYENPEQLASKPACQLAYRENWARVTGEIEQLDGVDSWQELLNYYLWLEALVDVQIGRILDALEARPEILDNTIVIFSSDHGELAGSHGLKGKACTMYREQMNVPLIIADFSGRFVAPTTAGGTRSQLGGAIDLAPTLLEMASPGSVAEWFSHLSGITLVPALTDPLASGRPYLLATEDAYWGPMDAPWHVLGYWDERWKLALYHDWYQDTVLPDPASEQRELYDRDTTEGRLELANIEATAAVTDALRDELLLAHLPGQIRAPLPGPLQAVQQRARLRYLTDVAGTTVIEVA
jgi:arylsulfatase A-like enzyme